MAGEGMTPEELRDWLNARPEETRAQEAAWIGSRAAARALPAMFEQAGMKSPEFEARFLVACRCVLTAEIAGVWPTPEIRSAAISASNRASGYDIRGSTQAASAASSAARVARASGSAVDFAVEAVRTAVGASDAGAAARASIALVTDLEFLSTEGIASGPRPLWNEKWGAEAEDTWFEGAIALVASSSAGLGRRELPTDWTFWIEWYPSLLFGKQQSRELLSEIALIPDEDWAKGSAHVNAMIGDLVRKHAVARSFLAEQIDRNAEGLFTAVPVRDIDGEILANAVAKVADRSAALRAAVRSGNNALIAILPMLDDLDDTVARYFGNPLRLHDDFREAHQDIGALLDRGELSPDRLIDRLQRSLETGALDCEGNSEACTRAVQTRVNVRALGLSGEDQGKLRALSRAAQAESDADLRRDLADDLEVGLDTAQPQEKRANAMKREGSRLIRIAEKRGEALNALNDTAKTIKSADTVWDFVTIIWHWFI